MIALLRIPQYTKNLFIFLPLFFAHRLLDMDLLARSVLAGAAFCLLASAVYIFNDLYDLEEDRLHPRKKNRPLPAGRATRGQALCLMVGLLASAAALFTILEPAVSLLALLYVLLNVLYTVRLKHMAIVDILCIALGFVIRIFVGGAATDIPISMWIVVMTFLLALFLALGKRRDDVLIYQATQILPRSSIQGYNLPFIDAAMMVMTAVTLVAYIMYTIAAETIAKFGSDKLYITALFVLLGLLRYLQISLVEGRSGNPSDVLLRDRFIQFSLLGWIVTFGMLIYR